MCLKSNTRLHHSLITLMFSDHGRHRPDRTRSKMAATKMTYIRLFSNSLVLLFFFNKVFQHHNGLFPKNLVYIISTLRQDEDLHRTKTINTENVKNLEFIIFTTKL